MSLQEKYFNGKNFILRKIIMVTIVSFDTQAQISRSHIPLMAEEYLNSYNALTDRNLRWKLGDRLMSVMLGLW